MKSISMNGGLAAVNANKGSFIAFATAPDAAAIAGNTEDCSIYTNSLIKYLPLPNAKIEDMMKRVREDVAKVTNNTQIPWENTCLVKDFYFNAKEQQEVMDNIYQEVRNAYSVPVTLIDLSGRYQIPVSEIFRIYQRVKSYKPGGIIFDKPNEFEKYITENLLDMKFYFEHYLWKYDGVKVIMGDLFHEDKI